VAGSPLGDVHTAGMLAGSVLPPLLVEAPPDPATAAPLPPLVVVAPPGALTAAPPTAPVPPAALTTAPPTAPVPPAGSESELCVALPHAAGASPNKTGSNNLHLVKPSMSPSWRVYAPASVTARQNAAPWPFLTFIALELHSSRLGARRPWLAFFSRPRAPVAAGCADKD